MAWPIPNEARDAKREGKLKASADSPDNADHESIVHPTIVVRL